MKRSHCQFLDLYGNWTCPQSLVSKGGWRNCFQGVDVNLAIHDRPSIGIKRDNEYQCLWKGKKRFLTKCTVKRLHCKFLGTKGNWTCPRSWVSEERRRKCFQGHDVNLAIHDGPPIIIKRDEDRSFLPLLLRYMISPAQIFGQWAGQFRGYEKSRVEGKKGRDIFSSYKQALRESDLCNSLSNSMVAFKFARMYQARPLFG